jgi:chromosomal replication initiator protein
MNNDIWGSVLAEIELSVSRASYATWFQKSTLESYDSHKAVILVPNIFTKQQLEVKFNKTILSLLEKHGVAVKTIVCTITPKDKQSPKEQVLVAKNSPTTLTPKLNSSTRLPLNDKYNFDNFIVGSGNELAYAACQSIANHPGEKYNPLFLYGGVGLGKTHLIQAVGNGIKANNPEANIVYVSTETFVNEFLEYIQFKKKGFSTRYRSADVLIVDDIQFIAGKEKTQEEFFHTFNALHQANKQIIITSDKPPKAIPTLEDRLRSRFEWGMAIDIQPPDIETRQAILQNKAASHNMVLPEDVVEYLAKNIQTNIRELEGSLNQLIAYCELRDMEPDIDIAKELIKGKQHMPKHLSPKSIIEKTAEHFDISVNEITSSKRDKSIVVPRQFAMYLLRSELHLSFPKIAVELGRKDHTTALHSVEKIQSLMSNDFVTRQHLTEIREMLHG